MKGYLIRPACACKCLFLKAFCVFALVGCASVEQVTPLASGEFELRGKVSVAQGGERYSARFVWQQQRQGFAIELWGPLGQGRVRLEGDPQRLAVVDAGGEVVSEGPPAAVMREHVGWTLPLEAFGHWARGAPTPDLPLGAERYDAQGRLIGFEQLGWAIACGRHTEVGSRWLPARVTAERPGYRVLMVLSHWRL